MKLSRCAGNPIIQPNPACAWEAMVTTNPGAWYDADEKQVKLLYRAAGHDEDHRIYLGLATSCDGYRFERAGTQPVFGPGSEGIDGGCVEDPRIVKMGRHYYITYAARPFPPGQYWLPENFPYRVPEDAPPEYPLALRRNLTASCLAITTDFVHFVRAGRLTDPMVDDRDVMLFPEKVGDRYVMLHRPMTAQRKPMPGTERPSMWIAFSDDLLRWRDSRLLIEPRYEWERVKVGGSCPPLRTEAGWLTLYHGVGPDGAYRVGAMLLDLEDPSRVLHRSPQPILEPQAEYEKKGFVNNVVFPCGNVVIGDDLLVYYGGADMYCCVAGCALPEMVKYLRACPGQ